MPAFNGSFCAIDFETTGAVAGLPVEPWQVGLVQVENGQIVDQWESLIRLNPRPFHPKAPGRHDELMPRILEAPDVEDVARELVERCTGRVLVAHNAATEKKCLNHLAPLHRFEPWIDTLKLSRGVLKDLDRFRLMDVAERLQLTVNLDQMFPEREAHDALYDAAASALILMHLLSLPGWEFIELDQLNG